MSVVCYYSLQFNNQIVLKHPDWGWVDEQGSLKTLRWYVTSLNSPYRQYVTAMMEELFSRYEIDELFLDIFGIQFYLYHQRGVEPFGYSKYDEDAWNRTTRVMPTGRASRRLKVGSVAIAGTRSAP